MGAGKLLAAAAADVPRGKQLPLPPPIDSYRRCRRRRSPLEVDSFRCRLMSRTVDSPCCHCLLVLVLVNSFCSYLGLVNSLRCYLGLVNSLRCYLGLMDSFCCLLGLMNSFRCHSF